MKVRLHYGIFCDILIIKLYEIPYILLEVHYERFTLFRIPQR